MALKFLQFRSCLPAWTACVWWVFAVFGLRSPVRAASESEILRERLRALATAPSPATHPTSIANPANGNGPVVQIGQSKIGENSSVHEGASLEKTLLKTSSKSSETNTRRTRSVNPETTRILYVREVGFAGLYRGFLPSSDDPLNTINRPAALFFDPDHESATLSAAASSGQQTVDFFGTFRGRIFHGLSRGKWAANFTYVPAQEIVASFDPVRGVATVLVSPINPPVGDARDRASTLFIHE